MTIKTIGELKEALEDYMVEDDTPIMAVHQPSWPLREWIGGLWLDGEDVHDDDEEESDGLVEDGSGKRVPQVLYIVLGGQPSQGSPYGPRRAFEEV